MERTYFDNFDLAGACYYDLPLVFNKLKVGTLLTLRTEPENRYDEYAIAIYFKKHKIGFVPATENQQLSKLLQAGVNVFEARVQTIKPDAHPAHQIRVVLYIVKAGERFYEENLYK